MGALTVTVVLSGGATATAASGVPGGPGGHVVPDSAVGSAVDDGGATTGAQRLAAMGDQWSRDRLADALAISRAALDAADASGSLGSQGPQVDGMRSSVEALRALVRTHEGTAVPHRGGGGSPVLPDSVTAPPVLTTAERLAVAQEVAALAADLFRVALEVEATVAATAAPGLPGLDAPPLQLTVPQPLEALAVPAAPVAAPDGAPADVAGAVPVEPGAVAQAPVATEAVAPAPVEQGAGGASVEAVPDDAPVAPEVDTADAQPSAGADGQDGTVDPAAGEAGDVAAPTAALPTELAAGLADLEAAVAVASDVATTELLSLEARPVLPTALRAATVGRYASFLPDSWTTLGLENGRIPEALLCAPDFAPDFLLRCDAAAALEAVNEAYRLDFGEDLEVVSGYRSFEQQAVLKVTKGWLAAPAGRSNHGLGVAVDLGGFGGLGQFDSPRYRWMVENGEEFGWFHPEVMRPGGGGPPEPWHFEFGID